jgi:hypothetical protein
MHHRLSICAAALAATFMATAAAADTLGTRANQRGVVTHIDEGLYQLGVDSTLQLNWLRDGDTALSRSNITGNAMLRYFIKPKLGVSGRAGGFYRSTGDTRDLGFLGSVWANYFMRLGEGMFFAPGAGAGLALGQRDIPTGTGTVAREGLFGAQLAGEMNVAMFLNQRFSLTAGPQLSLLLGSAGGTFVDLAGSFKVGAVYSY